MNKIEGLHTANVDEIKSSVAQTTPTQGAIEDQARAFIDGVMAAAEGGHEARSKITAEAEHYAQQLQKECLRRGGAITAPIKDLQAKSSDGGEVAKALIDLRDLVTQLDPKDLRTVGGWRDKLSFIPGIGNPIKNYFQRFESTQTIIGSVLKSLEMGREELKRDNLSLLEDQKLLKEATTKLHHSIEVGEAIEAELNRRLEEEIPQEDPKHRFLREEILFPLRQRLMDLQQQLAVSQQGIIASEILVRNNKELIRGVNRASSVTISALEVAVTTALALANQRIVLDKVEAVNKTTGDLIASTSRQLKEQGAVIQRQASQATLNMDNLKDSFATLLEALDDISTFRSKALDQMSVSIQEMKALTGEAQTRIDQIEEGSSRSPRLEGSE